MKLHQILDIVNSQAIFHVFRVTQPIRLGGSNPYCPKFSLPVNNWEI